MRRTIACLGSIMAVAGLTACGRSAPNRVSGSRAGFAVVAAENFWGSIAKQLAGSRARVRSIIVNPNADPHSYQPSAADARTIAGASMLIVNGLGYDTWASELDEASPSSSRLLLNVGHLLGLPEGSNPHRWYFPKDVLAVTAAIVADYDKLDPADSHYFAEQQRRFETGGSPNTTGCAPRFAQKYAGVPVGYSESIFQGLGEDLHLRLMTPYSFAKAIAEGTDVSAEDKQIVDRQAEQHLIKVWVYNSQNATPDVQRVNELARAAHIPVTTITETLSPSSDTFEQWQDHQLDDLLQTLQTAAR